MISKELAAAREYEEKAEKQLKDEDRPVFHLSPRIGWLNDPNGFSFYEGRYHLFYQYHPYDSFWGPMHWGHAVSDDLLSWEYLPCALAPDEDYDGAGCFSGSAVTLPDGRQLLMYTGCEEFDIDEFGRWKQSQCLAVSDGCGEYVKYEGNPVINGSDLPEGGDPYEFRDPYIWQAKDGTYRAVVANARRGHVRTDLSDGAASGGEVTHPKKRPPDLDLRGGTQLNLFRSDDAFTWERSSVLFEDEAKIGIMWECPNFFPLDGRHVLIASPMDMEAEEADGSIRFPQGNNVCCIAGTFDEDTEEFFPDRDGNGRVIYRPVDLGLDFYAPQVMRAPDGRTIMIAWMQDPKPANLHDKSFRIFGQMSIPRELSLRDGMLMQRPVRELDARMSLKASREAVIEDEEISVDGICGRMLDLEAEIKPCEEGSFDLFRLRFAAGEGCFTELRFDPAASAVTIDRSHAGYDSHAEDIRRIKVRDRGGSLRLRLILDRWSAELFINDGEQTMSLTLYDPAEAGGISFGAEGRAFVDVRCRSLEK